MPKKNLRNIPRPLRARLEHLGGRYVIAACSRFYTAEELIAGKLRHLGVGVSNGKPIFPKSIVPAPTSGKYSDRNVNGHEIVRKDLPKETHHNAVEAPDWGDRSNGTHTVYLPYEKYPRDFVGPQFTQIKVTAHDLAGKKQGHMLVFEIDRVLDRKDKNFEDNLLESLNILQENVGTCGVQKSGATFVDYLKTTTVSWEILPPGTREDAVSRLFRNRKPSPEEKTAVEERYDFLMGLKPKKLVYGTSGLQRYFGGLIEDDLIVFENIEYGNAIYIMFEDWKTLSQRTRTELLSGRFGNNFERVSHASGWKSAVKAIIKKREPETR
jgi:hypothetical protein